MPEIAAVLLNVLLASCQLPDQFSLVFSSILGRHLVVRNITTVPFLSPDSKLCKLFVFLALTHKVSISLD